MGSALAEFLDRQLQGRGKQAQLARKIGRTDGTVSKWRAGEQSPDFEGCLGLAVYFEKDPEEIFEMADRPEYRTIYQSLFSKYLDKIKTRRITEFDLYTGRDLDLHIWLQDLCLQGKHEEISKQLWYLDRIRQRLGEIMDDTGSAAACLIMEGPEGRVVRSRINTTKSEVTQLKTELAAREWKVYSDDWSSKKGWGITHLCLKKPVQVQFAKDAIKVGLQGFRGRA